jgi:hypothetical protein
MVSVDIDTGKRKGCVRLGFTEQKLTAYGGLALWSGFLHKLKFRRSLQSVLPHVRRAHNAMLPCEVALGFIGGILLGADKLSRIGGLSQDGALPEILGVQRMVSQSTFTRFFRVFTQRANEKLHELLIWMVARWPSRREGYTLDLDSTSLVHEDGHQEGVKLGYTRKGIKPCLHPLIAVLAEMKMVAGYWLRSGNTNDSANVVELIRPLLARLPSHIKISLVRADSGFLDQRFIELLGQKGLNYIIAHRLLPNVQALCRHVDSAWNRTEIPGLEVQEVSWHQPGQRLIVIRQRVTQRPQAGGRELFDLPGYRYQALLTDVDSRYSPVDVWRRYNGRADCENRIKEVGNQFGIHALCCQRFWATEAAHLMAIIAYDLCVLFQRELGIDNKVELTTLRLKLFCHAAVWSRPANAPTLRFAIEKKWRPWWNDILERLVSPIPPGIIRCNAAQVLQS